MIAQQKLAALWVYLAASPLAGLTLTLIAYLCAQWTYRKARFSPFANPVLVSIALIVMVLASTGTSYRTYFDGAQFVHFLLGPATVALALPLYRQWANLRKAVLPLLGALAAGSTAAIVSALLIAGALGASHQTLASIAPKSATTPIAMAIAEHLGGIPSLTAVLVICTGIFGAVTARSLLNFLHISAPEIRGFALGVASHGIGTARAFQVDATMGTYAGLGMGLNGVLTAVVAPALMPVVANWFH
ncbi:LrgB family protein [Burkholderia diffusa]|uniref:LrgB family protein n=1 Tax=Burkholderia diffusa TaxID=488732 RepID=UPI002AB089DE|nr:LrgB family protein [Burkholderia diffusa]